MWVVGACVWFDKLYIWHRGLKEQLKGYKRCMMLLEDVKINLKDMHPWIRSMSR